MEYAIETFSLTKVFSDWWGRDSVIAVNDLNLKVRTNEVFGLLGPNGSGKTTTLKMLLGLLYPTKGKGLLLGGQSTDPKITSRIGFMPEESYLYKYLNARETLDFYGRLFGLPSKLRKMRIEALLEMVGLKRVANRPIGTFSKGMARRIGLAQALINDPDLLILDEPTIGLDPNQIIEIRKLIIDLGKEKTVILCSHIMQEVSAICNRIIIINEGRIVAEDTKESLMEKTETGQRIKVIVDNKFEDVKKKIMEIRGVKTVDLIEKSTSFNELIVSTEKGTDIRSELSQMIIKSGFNLLEQNRITMSLEEVFIKLTK